MAPSGDLDDRIRAKVPWPSLGRDGQNQSGRSPSSRPTYFRNPWSEEDVFLVSDVTRSSSGGSAVTPSTPPPSRIPVKASAPRTPPTAPVAMVVSPDGRSRSKSSFSIGQLPPRKASLNASSGSPSRVLQSHGVDFEMASPGRPSIDQVIATSTSMQRTRSASAGGVIVTAGSSMTPSPRPRQERMASAPFRRIASDEDVPALEPLNRFTPTRPPASPQRQRSPVPPSPIYGTNRAHSLKSLLKAASPRSHNEKSLTPLPYSPPSVFADLPPTPNSAPMPARPVALRASRRPQHSPATSTLSSPHSSDSEPTLFTPPRPRRQRGISYQGSVGSSGRQRTTSEQSSRSGTPSRGRTTSNSSGTVVSIAAVEGKTSTSRHLGSVALPSQEGTTVVLRCSAPTDMEMKTVYSVNADGTPCWQYEIRLRAIASPQPPFTPPPSQPRRTALSTSGRRPIVDAVSQNEVFGGSEYAPLTPRQRATGSSDSPTISEGPTTPRRSGPPSPEDDADVENSPCAGRSSESTAVLPDAGGLGLAIPLVKQQPPTPGDWHGYYGYLSETYGSAMPSPAVPTHGPPSSASPFFTLPIAYPLPPAGHKISPLALRRLGNGEARGMYIDLEGVQPNGQTKSPLTPPASNEDERARKREVSRWSETETEVEETSSASEEAASDGMDTPADGRVPLYASPF